MTATIDLLDPEVLENPYPHYSRLRHAGPISYVEADDLWLVPGYDDVLSVLRDPGTFSSRLGMGQLMAGRVSPRLAGYESADTYMTDGGFRLLIAADPPDHTALRRLVSGPFSPRAIAQSMGKRVYEIANEVVDDLLAAGEDADMVKQVAYPLPVLVIAEVLGIPSEYRAKFKEWSDAMVGTLAGGLLGEESQIAAAELFGFFKEIVKERRENPGDDMISQLVSNELADGTRLTGGELTLLCVLLLIAGNETTTNLIGNGTSAMFANPDQARLLRDDPTLLGSAVEETLRFDGPVQTLFRATTRDVEFQGVHVPAGERVLPIFGAANHDERKWATAEFYDITRNPTDHVAFGNGLHFCLGAALARLEARAVAEVLLERTQSIEPAGEPERVKTFLLRGFKSLPVNVKPR